MCFNDLHVCVSQHRQGYATVRKLPCISVIYSVIINYYKFNGLKQHKCIIFQFCSSEVCYGSHQSKMEVSAELWPFGEA